jgi:subtilisin family serine protease
MLRTAAPHFRPGVDYGGSYDSSSGREARRRIAQSLAAQHGLRIVDDWPMPALGVDCFVMEAPAGVSLETIVERVARDARVDWVQAMNVFHVLAAHNDPLYPLQPSASQWHLADVHRIATGKRVRIAEIDTGVEQNHPDLAGRIAIARDFVQTGPAVAETHGTAVAGIIAARADNGAGIAGIAPEATLIALRACWQSSRGGGACSSFTLAKALQFALEARAEVINLSLGGPRDRLLERLLDAAAARGVTVVAAVDPSVRDGGFPASHRGVLAIAGEDGHDLADVLQAPARDIPTTLTGGQWGFVSGSSYAAAHVSGLVALLRELSPSIAPQQLKDALASNAVPGNAAARPLIVDACAAVAKTAGSCACACESRRDIRAALR